MRKTLAALGLTMFCQFAVAGPIVEIYECELNEGKTLADLSEMMATFTQYLREAGLEDSYTAHAGFQQIPIKPNSVNWIEFTNKEITAKHWSGSLQHQRVQFGEFCRLSARDNSLQRL